MVWSSTITTSGDCSACCGAVGCPCNTGAFPSNLNVKLTWLSGPCPAIDGMVVTISHTFGSNWSGNGGFPNPCAPAQVSFNCSDTGGGVYKFSISIAFGADLSLISYHTSYTCSPVDILFDPVNLIWSGSNGSSLCCPQTDTGTVTILGTYKVEVTP